MTTIVAVRTSRAPLIREHMVAATQPAGIERFSCFRPLRRPRHWRRRNAPAVPRTGPGPVDPRWRQRRALSWLAAGGYAAIVADPLLSRFAAGDEDAVRTVYRAYGRLVFAVAYKVLGDRGLAEEATQQAFLQAWRAAASFEPSKELGPWLATIARRAAIDVHRREARHAHSPLEDADPAAPDLVSLPPSVDRIYDAWQVRQALSELSPDEANLVRLQHMEGLTQSQIAERLNIPVGTVKSRSFRAHRRLAGLLGHLRGDDPADSAPRQPRIGTGGQR